MAEQSKRFLDVAMLVKFNEGGSYVWYKPTEIDVVSKELGELLQAGGEPIGLLAYGKGPVGGYIVYVTPLSEYEGEQWINDCLQEAVMELLKDAKGTGVLGGLLGSPQKN